jgi:epoxyqueuosine reductase
VTGFAIAHKIKRHAKQLGFDLVGIAGAEASNHADYFRAWLAAGQAGEMAYLGKRFEERVDPQTYFPGARSIICVAMNYFLPLEPPPSGVNGHVARYALGDDYHDVLKTKLHQLADWIREIVPDAQTKAAVDTAPVAEKELAARAGIGWLGKNSCLINPKIGSWLLLGEILTTLELPADAAATDHCGTCTRCIDACPTHAITAPYQLDARRCISYLTIEHRGEIAAELQPMMQDWLYGCDICQDVCPHNRKAPAATAIEFQPRFASGTMPIDDVLGWDEQQFRATLRGSAMKRVKLPILQRNAAIVAANAERA